MGCRMPKVGAFCYWILGLPCPAAGQHELLGFRCGCHVFLSPPNPCPPRCSLFLFSLSWHLPAARRRLSTCCFLANDCDTSLSSPYIPSDQSTSSGTIPPSLSALNRRLTDDCWVNPLTPILRRQERHRPLRQGAILLSPSSPASRNPQAGIPSSPFAIPSVCTYFCLPVGHRLQRQSLSLHYGPGISTVPINHHPRSPACASLWPGQISSSPSCDPRSQ